MTRDDAAEMDAKLNGTRDAYPGANPLSTGLTKREYFAAAALRGLMAFDFQDPDAAATEAVTYADALLLALQRDPPEDEGEIAKHDEY